MLLSKNIRISRIVSGTGRNFVADVLTCSITYGIFRYAGGANWNIPGLLPTILGTALAFFIGFNNNQAYDRWWEARKIWGALVNDSRTWARQLLQFRTPDAAVPTDDVRGMIYRHIGFLYQLKDQLRKTRAEDHRPYVSPADQEAVEGLSNPANGLLELQAHDLVTHYNSGRIDGFQFLELNRMLTAFCDHMGKSERIANTVFPTTYSYYTRLFIWIFIVTATLVSAESIGAFSIGVGAMIGYVFLTIYQIGRSLLNPFEDVITGIPLNQITRTIEINLLQALGETDVPAPVESVNGEYIL